MKPNLYDLILYITLVVTSFGTFLALLNFLCLGGRGFEDWIECFFSQSRVLNPMLRRAIGRKYEKIKNIKKN
jgi:hypothetical protein